MKTWQYNLLIAPIALCVRAPIMLTLNGLITLGEWAESASHYLAWRIPGFRSRPPARPKDTQKTTGAR